MQLVLDHEIGRRQGPFEPPPRRSPPRAPPPLSPYRFAALEVDPESRADPQLEVVLLERAELSRLPEDLLAPGALPELWEEGGGVGVSAVAGDGSSAGEMPAVPGFGSAAPGRT